MSDNRVMLIELSSGLPGIWLYAVLTLLVPLGVCLGEPDHNPLSLNLPPTQEDRVYFNQTNRKYHEPGCEWAIKCTRNCIELRRQEALQRQGIPCQVCGGEHLHDG